MHWLKPSLPGIAAAILATSLPATAKEKVSLSYLIDPVYEAVIWPLKNGKVASDTVEIEPKALGIVALIQAVGSKTFDISTGDQVTGRAAESAIHSGSSGKERTISMTR